MTCPTCGANPRPTPTSCAACRDADQRYARGDRPQYLDEPHRWHRPDIPANWHAMTFEALFIQLNKRRPTPPATIEAVLQAVRKRGLAALKEPATRERLRR